MKHLIGIFLLVVATATFTFGQSTATIVSAEAAAKTAVKVGDKAPAFTLADAFGKQVASKDLIKKGDLVIVFYRGAWCPFCNKYLHTLQTRLADIRAAGGDLVAISVEPADRSMAIAKKNELAFTVLSDPDLTVARTFHIVYQLPDDTAAMYKKNGLDLATYNRMSAPELPISATYVVSKKGKIVFAHVEPDYKQRADPDDIIKALNSNK